MRVICQFLKRKNKAGRTATVRERGHAAISSSPPRRWEGQSSRPLSSCRLSATGGGVGGSTPWARPALGSEQGRLLTQVSPASEERQMHSGEVGAREPGRRQVRSHPELHVLPLRTHPSLSHLGNLPWALRTSVFPPVNGEGTSSLIPGPGPNGGMGGRAGV